MFFWLEKVRDEQTFISGNHRHFTEDIIIRFGAVPQAIFMKEWMMMRGIIYTIVGA